MLVIGLTGGIGSGKSTVANLFKELGITIIDADQIARELITPDKKHFKKIVAKFGNEILDQSGQLNRKKLRQIIFDHPEKREWLEKLLHPLIRIEMQAQIKNAKSPYCILVIPLLTETHPNFLINRILVIDCDEKLQIQRTIARDKLSKEEIQKIIATQATRKQRLVIADDIIENNGSIEKIKTNVLALHQTYCSLATDRLHLRG